MPIYLIRQTGRDINGGTSREVRSEGGDGVTAGTNTLTSVSSAWTQADVGEGIYIGGVNQWRTITAVTDLNTLTFSGATIAIGTGRTWVIGGSWRTIRNALANTANAITNGDEIYIGAGVYREVVTTTLTSPTAEVKFIGDIDGTKTGDAGEIQWTAYLVNDETQLLTGNSSVLNISNKNFLTFKNITFISGSSSTGGSILTSSSTNIKIINCCFLGTAMAGQSGQGHIGSTVGFGVSSNWIIDGCIFIGVGTSINRCAITITLTTGTGNDYDANINIRNCSFIGAAAIKVTSSGSSQNEGGGVIIENCSIFSTFSSAVIQTLLINVGGRNFLYPVIVRNCFLYVITGLQAAELGALIENNNIICASSSARANVPIGPQSVTDSSVAPLFEFGQSFLYGFKPRPFGMPLKNSPLLCHGDRTIGPTNDIFNNTRPKGAVNLFHQGTATSAGINSLSDTSKNFGTSGNLNGYTVKILSGQGAGQTKIINSNSSTSITGDGLWVTQPDSTSKYAIYQGPTSMNSLISTGSTTVIQDNYANWGANFFQGYTCFVASGVASGQNFIVSGNNNNRLTGYFPMSITPSSGDAYELFWGAMIKGVVSTGSSYSVTDNLAQWSVGTTWPSGYFFANSPWRVMIYEGVGVGSNFCISGNSSNTLSGWNSFVTIPKSGSKYIIYQATGNITGYDPSGYYPPYCRDYIQTTVGCYSVTDTAIQNTGIVLSGSNSLQLFGSSQQDFKIATSGATTCNIWTYRDTHYQGTKQTFEILEASGIGIPNKIVTGVASAEMWEQLSLSFTGNAPGVATLRISSLTTGIGSSYWDAISIT